MMRKILALGMASLLSMPGAGDSAAAARASSASATAPARARTAAPQPGPPIRVVANRVIVPVTVRIAKASLVGDLQKDEFRVFADGMEQKILTFTSDPFPLSAVILIDNDLAQKQAEEVQKSLTTISAGFGPNDEAALVTSANIPTVVQEFSSNNDDLFTQSQALADWIAFLVAWPPARLRCPVR